MSDDEFGSALAKAVTNMTTIRYKPWVRTLIGFIIGFSIGFVITYFVLHLL
jgi:ABC-type cobalt transport system substrate-binding protein